jgi:uroporphyrinogen-III synthase
MRTILSEAKIFSLGPMVTQTLKDAGYEPTREADPHTIPGLIDCLLDYYTKRGTY